MSVMDLKSKGITWVGNIYQKFGAIWDDADDVVSQDTTKYVEDHVRSVKRFCTDIVQDLLPPRVDSVKHEGQKLSLERNLPIGSCVDEIIGTEKVFSDTGIKQSPIEPKAVDPEKNQLGGFDFITSLSMDSLERAESAISMGQTDHVSRKEKSDVRIEGNAGEHNSSASEVELISPGEKESFKSLLFSDEVDDDNENACSFSDDSPSTSVYAVESKSSPKVRTASGHFTVDLECLSAASSSLAYSEMDFSVVSCEKQVAETGLVSSVSSLLTESFVMSENSSENLPPSAVSCNDLVKSDSSDVLVSSTMAPIVSSNNKEVEVGLLSSSSVSPLESIGPSGNRHVEFCEHAQHQAVMSSLDFGSSEDFTDIFTDPAMETIDLFDEVKAEESCDSVNSSELYAVSRRAQKLKSYKKKIQDAFASKRKLAKEYELLAVWFGDTDIGSIEDASCSFLPSAPATSLDSKSLQKPHISDSEWELL